MKTNKIRLLKLFAIAITAYQLAACNTLVGSELHSNDSLRDEIAMSLGMNSSDVNIESRKNQGSNTYLTIKTAKGVRMACSLYGGGALGFGVKTQPTCTKIDSDGVHSGATTNCNALLKAAGRCQ